MKHIFLGLLALLTASTAFSAAGFPSAADVENLLNQGGGEGIRAAQLGTQITRKKIQTMSALYDFAVLGGAVATVNLKDVDGLDAVLPDNAVIRQVLIHTITPVTSSGASTLSIGANTTTDLLSAAAKTTIDAADEMSAGIPVGTAASAVVTTAARTLTASIGSVAITTGKFEVFVDYYLGR